MLPSLTDEQGAETQKYAEVYKHADYRMGAARFACAVENLRAVDFRVGYLDVGCGRGEMLDVAAREGFEPVHGVEVVDYLADDERIVRAPAWALPFADASFDLVTLFDVIEHLLPADAEPTCRELRRVARRGLFITAANYSSRSLGVELHVNRRPYDEWDAFFREVFDGDTVEWLPRRHGINSETWQITCG